MSTEIPGVFIETPGVATEMAGVYTDNLEEAYYFFANL